MEASDIIGAGIAMPQVASVRAPPARKVVVVWSSGNKAGQTLFTTDDMKVSDEALKDLRLQVENLLKPQDIKRIRKKIGLTQREAGSILGGGPNAFQKYEQATVTVSKPMSNLLRVLERHPEEVEEI